jgi:hypothetical protein
MTNLRTYVQIDDTLAEFAEAISQSNLPARERRKAAAIVQAARTDSVGHMIGEVVDRIGRTYNGFGHIKHIFDEARNGRIEAWRTGRGKPSAEQEARLRMLHALSQLNEIFPGVLYVSTPRPSGRQWDTWMADDLMRQQRWQLICDLALERMENR